MPDKPPCPKCRRNKKVVPSGDRNHFCGHCQIEFNVEPGEDSEAFRDPVRSLMAKESRKPNYGSRR